MATQQQRNGVRTTSTKTAAPAARAAGGQSVTSRLKQDLFTIVTSGDKTVSAFPSEEGNNIFLWNGTIHAPKGTVYEGLVFKLSLSFPSHYPYGAPTVRFVSPCYHPNVDLHGNICLDILKDQWSALYDVRTVLLSIQSLLGEPNVDSPLNSQAAVSWSNQVLFKEQMLRFMAEQAAIPAPEILTGNN